MYIGNGETKEFPLPAGEDGSTVYLVGGGEFVKAKGYEIKDGSILFSVPPPIGWEVAFGSVSAIPMTGLLTVIYPDGHMETVDEDPAQLLLAARQEREALRALLLDAKAEREKAVQMVKSTTEANIEVLRGRLLNYDAKAEAAIAAAVRAVTDDTAAVLNRNLSEIRDKHKDVATIHKELQQLTAAAELAATTGAESAAVALEERMQQVVIQVQSAQESTMVMKTEAECCCEEIQKGLHAAVAEAIRGIEQRGDVLLSDLRSMKSMLCTEIQVAKDRWAREFALEARQVKLIREEMSRASRRFEEIETHCRAALRGCSDSERAMLEFSGRMNELNRALEAKLKEVTK